MSLNDLLNILPAPKSGVRSHSRSEWELVDKQLGLPLSQDYKQFIDTYGVGSIDDFLWVHSPFSPNKYGNLLAQAVVQADTLREVKKWAPDDVPYPTYPEREGLIAWAHSDNGDVCFWQYISEVPRIVVQECKACEWAVYEETTTDFLRKLLNREIVVPFFPTDYPLERHSYRPDPASQNH